MKRKAIALLLSFTILSLSTTAYEVVKGDTTTKQVYDPDSLPVSVTLSPAEPTLIVRYRATGLELPPVRLTGLISKFC